jgi:MYXO-CTERM domain-containing protein
LVRLTDIPKDTCCSRVPNGPYTGVANAPGTSTGGGFEKEHRKRILAEGHQYNGSTVASDAKRLGLEDPGAVGGLLRITKETMLAIDDPELPPVLTPPILFPTRPNDVANIDHIIPRIDSNGCPCGSNDSSNALIISAELNTSMGRSCLDPRRAKILNKLTTPGTTLASFSEEETPSAEDVVVDPFSGAKAEVATGGCSTSTGGGAGGLLVALGAVLGMRRKRVDRN